ncbi:MAG: Rieske (2Fe-2S) protein, partial [Actinobacteria bacterium]|nr:Rieske (2Fe-2S) protein [Actinomycetota bacterium]
MITNADARTIPFDWYDDPAVLRLEREQIFHRAWQYAGRSDQVAEPGSFFTCDAGEIPIVVVRDKDGTLRAFLNVCRHRGSLVCEGEGRRETLQCPYHAWTYALDGSLRAAPRADREAGFDRSELGLLPVQVDVWGPFVFVNPDPAAAPLAETLGELPEL